MALTKGGSTDYRIVVSRSCSVSEKYAADELKRHLYRISGADFGLVDDRAGGTDEEILLGDSEHLAELDLAIDWGKLGDEGFVVRTNGARLIIAGGRARGTMYGAFTFLEKYLGCRWFSSGASRIPITDEIRIGQIDDVEVPVLEYRDVHYTDAFDADWAARNRVNSSSSRLDENRGGKVSYYPFVHSFDELIPSELYGAHPEYFPLIEGKRVNGYAQRCLSNPDVIRLAKERVEEWIQGHPEAKIISVSQNDTGKWCQCPECSALDEAEGSPAASILRFVNKIAEEVGKRHPDRVIDTLAYQYSRKPPKSLRPRENVIVRLCTIECCFSHPLESCDSEQNGKFREDVLSWSRIAPKLYVWDYVTNFAHYLMPFPNLYVLGPNIEFFVRHGVTGIFEEGNYSKGGNGEFAELRAYVLAKLLWRTDDDIGNTVCEFLDGYYKRSSEPIMEYIELMQERIKAHNMHVYIYSPPTSEYLTEDIVIRANGLFEEAERLADEPRIKKRVKIARLPIRYVMIERNFLSDEERKGVIADFFDTAAKAGISNINEWTTMGQYKEKLAGLGK